MTEVTIGMLIFPDFQLLDVAAPLELFRTTPGLRPILVAANSHTVSASNLPNVSMAPDCTFDDAPRLEVLFVPGGLGITGAIADERTRLFLAERAKEARYVTSVCTGALVLGAARLLQGYKAATHWRFMDLLPIVGAIPTDERVVIDGNRITSGGVTSGIDFGLMLANELVGKESAEFSQLWLQYAPKPPFNAGHPSSAPRAVVERAEETTRDVHEARAQTIRAIMRA